VAAPLVVGWAEWVALPAWGLLAVCAKVDTGAETSALHALDVERYHQDRRPRVRFRVQPLARRKIAVACDAEVVDEREVRASNGHVERRPVVRTALRLGLRTDAPAWPIELTLTDRRAMRYRMLLGRQALAGHALVDAAAAFLHGEPSDPSAFYG